MSEQKTTKTVYRPQLLYTEGRFISGGELTVGEDGIIVAPLKPHEMPSATIVDLPGKALLPGFINVHSHSFQRLIRGKAESRLVSGKNFWSWRGTMYRAASQLEPDDVYDAARMAFLEMALAGTTTVGEFHYLHNAPSGLPYDDPNLLSKKIIAAAQSVGIRIVLLRSAYLRSGYQLPADPGQKRFFESGDAFLGNLSALQNEIAGRDATVTLGAAPHSIRAVPLPQLRQIAAWSRAHGLPLHMHLSEQIAENTACVAEYGATPVELLDREGLLGPDFTAVHAIHLRPEEIAMLARRGSCVCSCPTTERNLGDGIVPADLLMAAGVGIALGSDSQAQIDPLEDARQLDYHLRLQYQQRAVLDQIDSQDLATRLFECATTQGARSLGVRCGQLNEGRFADFVTVDLQDISIACHERDTLLSLLVFGLNRSAVRDVAVAGRFVVRDGRQVHHEEIIARYTHLCRKVWSQAPNKAS